MWNINIVKKRQKVMRNLFGGLKVPQEEYEGSPTLFFDKKRYVYGIIYLKFIFYGGLTMSIRLIEEATELLNDSLRELESKKGSIQVGVQKLLRVSKMLENKEIEIWCEIQLGNRLYTESLKKLVKVASSVNDKSNKQQLQKVILKLEEAGLKSNLHYPLEEIEIKASESSGGYQGIGFIEDKYNDLVRLKKGNDGTYYKNNLNNHINYVRHKAYELATRLYNKIALTEAPKTAFDILKEAVEDKLLDLNTELAEKLMIAFNRVKSDNPEEWSQALATCRRFIEELADSLYRPSNKKLNGRTLGEQQYVNRIWAFMDEVIESDTNKELAKAHVDFIGSYIQRIQKQTNKGVHSKLTRVEAVKAVFHTYLIVADILDYLDKEKAVKENLNIQTATLDELQSFLNITKNTAKEIVKLRVKIGGITIRDLKKIKGIGEKTLKSAVEVYGLK